MVKNVWQILQLFEREKKRIRKYSREGMSPLYIAKRMRRSVGAVKRCLDEPDVPSLHKKRTSPEILRDILKHLKEQKVPVYAHNKPRGIRKVWMKGHTHSGFESHFRFLIESKFALELSDGSYDITDKGKEALERLEEILELLKPFSIESYKREKM